MFFIVSKLLWLVLAPVTLLIGALLIGIALSFARGAGTSRFGRRLALVAVLVLVVCGCLPVGSLLLRPLEDRFPPIAETFPAPTGIIVLGGSTDEAISEARHRPTIVESAGRVTEAVVLARRYPQARIVFSGGSGDLHRGRRTEAEDTRQLWIEMGIAPERITIENQSRNTDENARFTKEIVQPKAGETWLLVTSAFHMPRAVGLFRADDFPIVPYPVDYRTRGTIADAWSFVSLADGLKAFDFAVHEWVGLVAYRISGKTRVLFPAP